MSSPSSSEERSPRFVFWAALLVFASVSLGALVSDLDSRDDYSNQRHDKWSIAVCSISLTCAFVAVLAHFVMRGVFVNQQPEGLLATFNLLFWVVGLPAIMDPSHDLAVTSNGGVLNANLYFFSWAAFFCSLYISGHFAQTVSGGGVDFSGTPKKMAMWFLVAATSIILLAVSVKYRNTNDCGSRDVKVCNRNSYAIAIGAFVGFFGLLMVFLATRDMVKIMVETISALLVLILYAVGVGLITFGEGPAKDIGNQYFSSWIGFTASVFLAFQCIREVLHYDDEGSSSEGATNPTITTTTTPTNTKPEITQTPEGPMETVGIEDDKV